MKSVLIFQFRTQVFQKDYPPTKYQIYSGGFFMTSCVLNQNEQHMRARDAARYLGAATSTFWRWVGQGRIPQGVRLSARCTIWRKSDLDNFIEKCAGGWTMQEIKIPQRQGGRGGDKKGKVQNYNEANNAPLSPVSQANCGFSGNLPLAGNTASYSPPVRCSDCRFYAEIPTPQGRTRRLCRLTGEVRPTIRNGWLCATAGR